MKWRWYPCLVTIMTPLAPASGEPRLVVSPCDAVRRLAALHGTLCDVVTSIDASYGLPLIVILISTLLHLVVTPYFAIMEIMVSKNRPHFLVLQAMWCTMYFLRMIGLVEPGQLTIDEGKKTEIIISKLMMSMPSTGRLPERLEIFSRQLMMLQSISYEPMSMCTLNRSLITSVLAAVTIYLVIILQFQNYST
ncbi:gustatory receptor for sugar taste 43a-like isoform X2 [Trichoplusia ni]|uniref:Gustatory receptor for sugar taste 43a-like isoform X2 n=1 Tax=Trichoplusia ni TaxID=7111 RepID=A0A7E5WIE3_TRINI|nr:gustatory receptor for sugar taste 43a-like isoform X2 [Trichoplusia ni]